jgi:hypothetical protein
MMESSLKRSTCKYVLSEREGMNTGSVRHRERVRERERESERQRKRERERGRESERMRVKVIERKRELV